NVAGSFSLSHLFKLENLHNWWLTKYFFAPLYPQLVGLLLIGVAAWGKEFGIVGGVIAVGFFLLLIAIVGLIGAIHHHQVMLCFVSFICPVGESPNMAQFLNCWALTVSLTSLFWATIWSRDTFRLSPNCKHSVFVLIFPFNLNSFVSFVHLLFC
uniref:Uncharacterized protein n=1 Tax=Hucho hucho TaxID=62062 RepID=A0A4W5R9Y4_9TELE